MSEYYKVEKESIILLVLFLFHHYIQQTMRANISHLLEPDSFSLLSFSLASIDCNVYLVKFFKSFLNLCLELWYKICFLDFKYQRDKIIIKY